MAVARLEHRILLLYAQCRERVSQCRSHRAIGQSALGTGRQACSYRLALCHPARLVTQ